MAYLDTRDGPDPKCYFTSSALSNFVNHEQIPTKKKPFFTISSQAFSHTLSLVLPKSDADTLKQNLSDRKGTLQYAKVYMRLGDLIEGEFFNHYIKTGNVVMLSEGRSGVDHVYSLNEGILRLDVDKPTYERMGLNGVAIPSQGRKHVKARYAIEINLRLPSMVRGKKPFERIIWAFKNVLSHTVTWLFYDLKGITNGSGPIGVHHPKVIKIEPERNALSAVQVPRFPPNLEGTDHRLATELLEWLSLAMSSSPRIESHDNIDSYLSRYSPPHANDSASDPPDHNTQDLCSLYWHGLIPSIFIRDVFLAALKVSGTDWLGLSATSFDGRAYTFLRHKHNVMIWEYLD